MDDIGLSNLELKDFQPELFLSKHKTQVSFKGGE